MPIGITRSLGASGIPVWQGTSKDIQLAQGGFKLTATGYPDDTVIPAGTPLVINESTRVATFLDTAIAQQNESGAAVTYHVLKGSTIKIGDYLSKGAIGGPAYAVTAIDTTTSTLWDLLTVGTTIGAVTAGDTLWASTATGATAGALPADNALLYCDVVIKTGFVLSVSAVIKGTVYARRVPYTTSIEAQFDDIIYSQSK